VNKNSDSSSAYLTGYFPYSIFVHGIIHSQSSDLAPHAFNASKIGPSSDSGFVVLAHRCFTSCKGQSLSAKIINHLASEVRVQVTYAVLANQKFLEIPLDALHAKEPGD